jgi:hypothetical protein
MTMDDQQQLRVDLEALYAHIEAGWTQLGPRPRRFGAGGGCLGQQMCCVLDGSITSLCANMGAPAQWHQRWYAMAAALGFERDSAAAIPHWNDDPSTDWDKVKERVKDAIGRL